MERPALSLTIVATLLFLALVVGGAFLMDYLGWGPHGCLRPL